MDISKKKKIIEKYYLDTFCDFYEKGVKMFSQKHILPLTGLKMNWDQSSIGGFTTLFGNGTIEVGFNGNAYIQDEDELDSGRFTAHEYFTYKTDPIIGSIRNTSWKNVAQANILHELSHCFLFSCYLPVFIEDFLLLCKHIKKDPHQAEKEVKETSGFSDEGHGSVFQAVLKDMRLHIYNPVKIF